MIPNIAVIGLKGLPAYGGAAAVGENIIENLKDKYNFTVYASASHTNLKTGKYNGFYQIVFKKIPFKKLNSLYYYFVSALHALLKGKYDLIHLHHRDASIIIPFLRIKYKVILTTHGMVLTKKWDNYKWFFKIQDKLFLKFANIITCVSKKDKEIVENLITKKKIIYIPNGVEINSAYFSPQKKYKICFAAGRIVPDKGCHILLQALNLIGFKDSVVIVGDLDQVTSHKEEIVKLSKKLTDIKFTGLIKDKDKLFTVISDSEIFVYPSVIESMSMMLLEVASLKVPVLCSNIRENRDVFDDNEVLFFNPDDSVDLGKKIEWAITNEQLIKANAENAYKKIQKKHNWNEIADQYKDIYNKLIFSS